MKLSRLTLENFRCFEAATFDLSDPDEHDIDVPLDVVVLVGENGSGKSAVLDAITGEFTQLWSMFGSKLLSTKDIRLGASEFRIEIAWKDRLTSKAAHFAVRSIGNESGISPDETFDQSYKAWLNAILKPTRSSRGVIVSFDVHRLIAPQRVAGPNTGDVVRHCAEDALAPTILPNGQIRPRSHGLKQWIVNLDYARTKAKVDYGRDHPTWHVLRRALNTLLAPYTFEGVDDQFQVLFQTPTGRIPLEALSDGFRSVFVIVADLVFRLSLATDNPELALMQEGTCLVDEIDAHLHPRWQETVIPGLAALFPNVQFIVTTHSEIVVSTVQPKNVFRLNQANAIGATRQDRWFHRPDRSTVTISEEVFRAPWGTNGRQWILDPSVDTQRTFWAMFGSQIQATHRAFVVPGPVLLEDVRDTHGKPLPGLDGKRGPAAMFFVDELPEANWSHPCSYYFLPDNGEPIAIQHHWLPSEDIKLVPLHRVP